MLVPAPQGHTHLGQRTGEIGEEEGPIGGHPGPQEGFISLIVLMSMCQVDTVLRIVHPPTSPTAPPIWLHKGH